MHPLGRPFRLWPRAGLTLVELLLTASIMVIVLSIALPFLVTVERAWRDGEDRAAAMDGTRGVATLVTSDIRRARRISAVSSTSDPQGSLQLEVLGTDAQLHERTYYFDTAGAPAGLGWVSVTDRNLVTDEVIQDKVAGPVQSLYVSARRSDGVTPATHPWEARLVRVSATGATPAGQAAFSAPASARQRARAKPCGLFCPGSVTLLADAAVVGDVYCGGDLSTWSGSVTGGLAYAQGTVFGPNATEGVAPTPAPPMPALETSYYDDLIAAAQNEPSGDLERSSGQTLLSGGTLYVHGYTRLLGTAEVVGPGRLVVTHEFELGESARITGGAQVVVARGARLRDSGLISGGGLLYAVESVTLENTASAEADLVTPGDVSLGGSTSVTGLVYAAGLASVYGSVVGAAYIGSDNGIAGAYIEADPAVMLHSVPGLELCY